MNRGRRYVLCWGLSLLAFRGVVAEPTQPAGIDVRLPSAGPSGIPRNDTIPVSYYPAVGSDRARAPAVIILHPLGEEGLRLWRQFAKHLARHGIGAAVIVLPYHMERRVGREPAGGRFIAEDPKIAVQAYTQAISDVGTVTDWLARQPTVDTNRLGVVGVSLGAIIAHAAMGRDSRLNAGVAMLGGGDMIYLRERSVLFALVRRPLRVALTADVETMLRPIDPIATAANNRPRRVLMIEAARDDLVPPKAATELWEALGRPPIQWIDTNHFGLSLDVPGAFRTTTAYLQSAWGMRPADARIPSVHPPTIMLGWEAGLAARPTLAIEYHLLGLGHRSDHMSLLHLDAGLDAIGPFLGLGATINRYVDAGIGRRMGQSTARPYVSVLVAF